MFLLSSSRLDDAAVATEAAAGLNVELRGAQIWFNLADRAQRWYIANHWRDVRVVEGARLESVYTFIAYRGFESLSLRQFRIPK